MADNSQHASVSTISRSPLYFQFPSRRTPKRRGGLLAKAAARPVLRLQIQHEEDNLKDGHRGGGNRQEGRECRRRNRRPVVPARAGKNHRAFKYPGVLFRCFHW